MRQIGKIGKLRLESELSFQQISNFHSLDPHRNAADHNNYERGAIINSSCYPSTNKKTEINDQSNAPSKNPHPVESRIIIKENVQKRENYEYNLYLRNNSKGISIILQTTHEIWTFLRGMKNAESSEKESNGEIIILPHDMGNVIPPGIERYSEVGQSTKTKQCYLKHHKEMNLTIPNEEEDDEDTRSSFARREKEDEESKSVRKTRNREPFIRIPRHLDTRTWDYTDAINRISLEDGAITYMSLYLNGKMDLVTLINFTKPSSEELKAFDKERKEREQRREESGEKKTPDQRGLEEFRMRARERRSERELEGILEYRMDHLPSLMDKFTI